MFISFWIVDLLLAFAPYFKKPAKPREGHIGKEHYTILIPCYNGYQPTYLGEPDENVIFCMDGSSKAETIKKALSMVETPYTVIMDGDTVPGGDLKLAVQALEDEGADLASVRVLPATSPNPTLIERFQEIEYALAMRTRRWSPFLTSGALIIGRTESLRKILNNHSGNFVGEDLEVGLRGRALGMKVIHVDFPAYTQVPRSLKALLKQRVIWFHGFTVIASRFGRLKAFLPHAIYGILFYALMTPLKLFSLDLALPLIYAIYLLITLAGLPPKTWLILLYPLYSLLKVLTVPIAYVAARIMKLVDNHGWRR